MAVNPYEFLMAGPPTATGLTPEMLAALSQFSPQSGTPPEVKPTGVGAAVAPPQAPAIQQAAPAAGQTPQAAAPQSVPGEVKPTGPGPMAPGQEGIDPEKINAWDKILEALPFDLMTMAVALMRDKQPGESSANIMGEALAAGIAQKRTDEAALVEGAREARKLDLDEREVDAQIAQWERDNKIELAKIGKDQIPVTAPLREALVEIVNSIDPTSPVAALINSLGPTMSKDNFRTVERFVKLASDRKPSEAQATMALLNAAGRARLAAGSDITGMVQDNSQEILDLATRLNVNPEDIQRSPMDGTYYVKTPEGYVPAEELE